MKEANGFHRPIYDQRATTIDGMRAKVKCILLADGEMRDVVADVEDATHGIGLYVLTCNLIGSLFQDLSDGSITDATCANVAFTEARP